MENIGGGDSWAVPARIGSRVFSVGVQFLPADLLPKTARISSLPAKLVPFPALMPAQKPCGNYEGMFTRFTHGHVCEIFGFPPDAELTRVKLHGWYHCWYTLNASWSVPSL